MFVKKIRELYQKTGDRDRKISYVLLLGILMNVFLSVCKILIGQRIRSTALLIDGVNGLADVLSYMLGIVMLLLSNLPSDARHPMGYGRIEYLSSFLITLLISYLGGRSIFLSVREVIINDGAPAYDGATLVIIVLSFVLKFFFGCLAIKKGNEFRNNGLIVYGNDARMDSFNSVGLLIAIAAQKLFVFDLEPYFSILIAIGTLKMAFTMLSKEMDQLLGSSVDPEYVRKIKQQIVDEKGVENVFNLVIHDYGENNTMGSVNIEVNKDMKAKDITILSNRIIRKAKENGLNLTSIGISGSDPDSKRSAKMWDSILSLVSEQKAIQRAYAFMYDKEEKVMSFYVLVDPAYDSHEEIRELKKKINVIYPDIRVVISLCQAE